MKLFEDSDSGRNRLKIFQRLLKKYSLAGENPLTSSFIPIRTVDSSAQCINNTTPEDWSAELKLHFVYICRESDCRLIKPALLEYGFWNSVLISPLEWNCCVAGFLRSISIERDAKLNTISFQRSKVTAAVTEKETKGICKGQKILTQTVTEEEPERIGKTGIAVNRQKRKTNRSCSALTSLAESKRISEAAPQLPGSHIKKKRQRKFKE